MSVPTDKMVLTFTFPITLGALLDRSFRLAPAVFLKLFPLYLLGAVLDTLMGAEQLKTDPNQFLILPVMTLRSVISFYLVLIIPVLASIVWRGDALGGITKLLTGIRKAQVFQAVILWVRLTFGCLLYGLPLIVSLVYILFTQKLIGFLLVPFLFLPLLMYVVYRLLAFYVLILEDTTAKQAIAISKQTLSFGKWYKPSSPMFRVAVIGLTMMLLAFGAGGAFAAVSIPSAQGSIGLTSSLIIFFFHSLINAFLGTFVGVAYTGLYFDAKARFHGSDLLDALQS